MGSIYKRGDTYWVQFYRNGKPYRESTKSNKEADARLWLKKREGDVAQNKFRGLKIEKTTFEQVAALLLTHYKINGLKSLDRLERSIKHLSKHFSGMRIADLRSEEIDQYILSRKDAGAENATINRELAALKQMLRIGFKKEKVIRVPEISMLKENNVRKGFFELEQFMALRKHLPDYLKGLVTVAYHFGCRRDELLNLKWEQVDLHEGEFTLTDCKNGEDRSINLNDETFSILVSQRRKRDSEFPKCEYVFFNYSTGCKIKQFPYKLWHKACKLAGISGRIPHDFRRTAAKNLIRSGTSQDVAREVLGHKTASMFSRYHIIDKKDKQIAAKRLDSYLKSEIERLSEREFEQANYQSNFEQNLDKHNLSTKTQKTDNLLDLVGKWEDL